MDYIIQQSRQQSWQQARQYLVAKNFSEALALLEPLSQQGYEPELWLDYAQALFATKQYPKAQSLIAKVLHHQPHSLRAQYLQANIKYKQGFYKEALVHYRYVLSQKPKDCASLVSIAYCYCQLESFEEALIFFEQSEQLLEKTQETWNLNYGMSLLFCKQPKKALIYLDKALEEFADDAQLYFHRGLCYGLLGDNQGAKKAYHDALQRDKTLLTAHHNLAILYYGEQEYERAIPHLRTITQQDSKNIIAKTLLDAYEGTPLKRLPQSFIQTLFDQYAFSYNSHLKDTLGYQAPAIGRSLLSSLTGSSLQAGITIDLGCGTGLAGPVYRDLATQLIGVDLSAGMLEQAKKLGIYDQLIEKDVLQFLTKISYQANLILAFELINYLGHDLSLLLKECERLLLPDGWLLFTAETSDNEDIQLTQHARYAFHKDYLMKVLQSNGLKLKICHEERLRAHHDSFIRGYFVIAQKNNN